MSHKERLIPDVILERYLAGALEPEARERTEAELAASETDRRRLEELRAASAAFLVSHPPGPLVARIQQAQGARRWRWVGAALATAAAALGALVVRPPPKPEPEFTAKGGVILRIYRNTLEGTRPLAEDDWVAPGDELGFEVRASAPGYIALLGRDGAGHVTRYYPPEGDEAAAYTPEHPELPDGTVLDEAPGPETLYLLYSPEPFPLAWALELLKAGRPLEEARRPALQIARRDLTKRR